MSTAADALLSRFWAKVQKTSGCWLWTGACNSTGYAVLTQYGRLGYAHRFAHEALVGPIPTGFQVDHLCNVRHCVNPAHLEAVTVEENARRRSERQLRCIRGHVRAGNLDSGGHCRTCMTEGARRRSAARKQMAA